MQKNYTLEAQYGFDNYERMATLNETLHAPHVVTAMQIGARLRREGAARPKELFLHSDGSVADRSMPQ